MAGAAVFGFVDLFGIGGGARTTGAAGVDGVGFGFVDRDRELDPRCLGHLRDCDRLARKGAAFKRGGGSRPLRVCRRLRHRRREHDASRAGGTALAAGLAAQSGSWTLEVYFICATVTG